MLGCSPERRQAMVLHLLLVHLKPGTNHGHRERLTASFSGLRAIEESLRLGCVIADDRRSTHDVALFAYLSDASALERFGTDARYMRYLQRSFLPLAQDFISVDVRLDDGRLPDGGDWSVCFCLDVPPTTYDWQVRSLLSRAAETPGAAVSATLGIALNDRQPYRAAGVIYTSADRAETVAKRLGEVTQSGAVTAGIWVAGRLTLWERG